MHSKEENVFNSSCLSFFKPFNSNTSKSPWFPRMMTFQDIHVVANREDRDLKDKGQSPRALPGSRTSQQDHWPPSRALGEQAAVHTVHWATGCRLDESGPNLKS